MTRFPTESGWLTRRVLDQLLVFLHATQNPAACLVGNKTITGREVDVLMLCRRFRLHEFEIKTSRRDWRRQKHKVPPERAPESTTLVTFAGLVRPEEVDEGVGLIYATEHGSRYPGIYLEQITRPSEREGHPITREELIRWVVSDSWRNHDMRKVVNAIEAGTR